MLKLLFKKKNHQQPNKTENLREGSNIPYVKMSQSQRERALATLGPLRPVCGLHLLVGTCLYSLNGK